MSQHFTGVHRERPEFTLAYVNGVMIVYLDSFRKRYVDREINFLTSDPSLNFPRRMTAYTTFVTTPRLLLQEKKWGRLYTGR